MLDHEQRVPNSPTDKKFDPDALHKKLEADLRQLLKEAYPGFSAYSKMPIGWGPSARSAKFQACLEVDLLRTISLAGQFRFEEAELIEHVSQTINRHWESALQFLRVVNLLTPTLVPELINLVAERDCHLLITNYKESPSRFEGNEQPLFEAIAKHLVSLEQLPLEVKKQLPEQQTKILEILIVKEFTELIPRLEEFNYDAKALNQKFIENKKLHTIENFRLLKAHSKTKDFEISVISQSIAQNDPAIFLSSLEELSEIGSTKLLPAVKYALSKKGFISEDVYQQIKTIFPAEDLPEVYFTALQGDPILAFGILSANDELTKTHKEDFFQSALESDPKELFKLSDELSEHLAFSSKEYSQIIIAILKKSESDAFYAYQASSLEDPRLCFEIWQKFYERNPSEYSLNYRAFDIPTEFDQEFFNHTLKAQAINLLTLFPSLKLVNQQESQELLFKQLKKEDLFFAASNARLLGITEAKKLEEIAKACLSSSATKTIDVIAKLDLESEKVRGEIALGCCQAQRWLTIEKIANFRLSKDNPVYEKIIQTGLDSDPYRVLGLLENKLPEQSVSTQKALVSACLKNNFKKFVENLNSFKPQQEAIKQVLAEIKDVDASNLLQLIKPLGFVEDQQLIASLIKKLPTSSLKKLDYFIEFKLDDQPLLEAVIFEGILEKYNHEDWKSFLINYLPKLPITDDDLRKRIASRLMDSLYSTTPANFHCLGLTSTDPEKEKDFQKFREELVLKIFIQEKRNKDTPDVSSAVKYLNNFGLEDHSKILEAVIETNTNASNYIPYLHQFRLPKDKHQKLIPQIIKNYLYSGTFNEPKQKVTKLTSQMEAYSKHILSHIDPLKQTVKPENLYPIIIRLSYLIPDALIKDFGRVAFTDNTYNRRIYQRLAINRAEQTLTLAMERGETDQFTITILRKRLAKDNPEKAVSGIRNQIADPNLLRIIALETGRHNFNFLKANYIRYGIKDDLISEAILIKLEAEKKCIAVENIEFFGITDPATTYRLLASTAANDIRKAFKYANAHHLSKDGNFLHKAFFDSLANNNLANAAEVVKLSAELSGTKNMLITLGVFTQAVNQIEGLDPKVMRLNMLLERAMKANIWPEKLLLTAFQIFDDQTDLFIAKILATAGPTFGKQIIEELNVIYDPKKKDQESTITEDDQKIIMLFVNSRFRGFTKATFDELKDTLFKTKSFAAVEKKLKGWQEISTAILTGKPINPELQKTAFFAHFVYSAYSPVGMSFGEVKEILTKIADNSKHLERFPKIPTEGYLISLQDLSNLQLKSGVELNLDALKDLTQELIATQIVPISTESFNENLLQISMRAMNKVKQNELLGFLVQQSKDPRIKANIQQISTIVAKVDFDLQDQYALLGCLSDLFNALEEDVIDEVLGQHLKDQKIDLEQGIRAKLTEHLRQQETITNEQILGYFNDSLTKIFNMQQGLIQHEYKKFVREFAGAASEYRIYISKDKASYFGRAGAGLCTAQENWSWNNVDFLQMVMVDTDQALIVGNIQLHLFTGPDQKPSVLARLNPTSKFLNHAPRAILAEQMIRTVHQFADDHNLSVYFPEQSSWHQLTNRTEFAPHLMKFFGTGYNLSIQLTANHFAGKIYRSAYKQVNT